MIFINLFAINSIFNLTHFFVFRSKESENSKTQFVVTLDSLGFPTKRPTSQKDDTSESRRVKPVLKTDERKKAPISSRIGKRKVEIDNEIELRKAVENSSKSPTMLKRKRTPIKFDVSEQEAKDLEPAKKRRSRSSERRSADKEHRRSSERDTKRDSRSNDRERDSGEFTSKIRTLKTGSQNKYDNLPPRKCCPFQKMLNLFFFGRHILNFHFAF